VDDVKKYCMRNIKWPFTPRKIICLKHLPKNSSGKVDKVRLKEMLKASGT
jgi:acyl-coenzyme A synthetase/AMP-(fatty) acid ligase